MVKNGTAIDAETAELVRAEYIHGKASIRELADKYDLPFLALKQRAVYGKWSSQRGQGMVKTKMLAVAKPFVQRRDSFKAKAVEFSDRMRQNVEETLDIIDTIRVPRTWPKLALREQVMSALQKRGWTAFGLDAPAGGTTNVLVNVQSGLGSLPGQQADVIDVESVPTKVSDAQQ